MDKKKAHILMVLTKKGYKIIYSPLEKSALNW